MSRLNLIVESLLRDIIEAQHAANCHAAGLARQYGKHGGVRGFQLPSAQIGSLEFDLKYAVTGTSGVEERQVLDAEQCSLFQQELAERVPAYAIRSIVMAVVHSNLPADEARSDFPPCLPGRNSGKGISASTWGRRSLRLFPAMRGPSCGRTPDWTRDCWRSFWRMWRRRNSWTIPIWPTCSRVPRGTPSGRSAARTSGKASPPSLTCLRKVCVHPAGKQCGGGRGGGDGKAEKDAGELHPDASPQHRARRRSRRPGGAE